MTYSRSIPKLVLLPCQNLPQNPSHDLPTACLREIRNHENCLGRCKWSNTLSHLQDKVFTQLIRDLVAIFDSNKSVDSLTSQFIGDSYHSSFSDSMMFDQRSFDFCGGETMTANVYDIVNAATNPIVAFVITASSITSELERSVSEEKVEGAVAHT